MFRAFAPTLILAALMGGLALRSLWQGRPDIARDCLLMFCLLGAFPFIATIANYSTIAINDEGISALAFGIVRWSRATWSEIDYLQRVRVLTTLNRSAKPASELYYIGVGKRKAFRMLFRSSIRGLLELTSILDKKAGRCGISIYSVDTVPKQYGQAKSGDIVPSLSSDPT
jgi:hypothetical protein